MTILPVALPMALALAAAAFQPAAPPMPPMPPTAQRQIATAQDAVARYREFEVARREGWAQFGGEDTPLMGEHWTLARERGGVDYVHGDRIDFARPSNLMYSRIGGRRVLTGIAYTVRLGPGEPVPDGFAGQDDRWHVHDFEAAIAAALQDRPLMRWLVNGWIDANFRNRGDNRGRVAMVHLWTMPNPDGPFADYNRRLPYMKLGLPLEYADGASLAAAQGLHLATENGCRDTMDGRLWIANVDRRATQRLRAGCRAAAAHVAQGLATRDRARINAMAEHGWHMFDRVWNAELTDAQRARIAAMSEHGGDHEAPDAHHAPAAHRGHH